jgi:2-keto-4-pentenoate hydratase/2-oxohepta-3-ene-1,7-dioic acid hydratase in catechol pathway
MKFVTYASGAEMPRVGVLEGEKIFDLGRHGYAGMLSVIGGGEAAIASAKRATGSGEFLPLSTVRLLAPIQRPPRIFCIGLNYASHAAESQMKVQAVPTVFMKLASSVIGPDEDVVLPRNSTQPDYEAELAVVISRPGYRIAADDWEQYVFGYTILNDVSARDVQLATSQWTLGKSFPTFTPLGPAIVTADETGDPHQLDISLTIGGEVLQSSNTRHLIFRIPQLIEYISGMTPLEAGDIISTGTPEGVGLGRTPQRWLRPGEEMVIAIETIGELRNRTRAEA